MKVLDWSLAQEKQLPIDCQTCEDLEHCGFRRRHEMCGEGTK